MSRWFDETVNPEPQLSISYNGCFGWQNPVDNRRYAIVGSSRSTFFVEVTNPSNPVLRHEVLGRRDNCIWREMKTFGNYAYLISDDDFPNSLQIVDMSFLPDSVHIVMDSDSIFSRAHTLFIDGNKLYANSVKTNLNNFTFSSMNVYSLQNPEKPLLLRRLDQDFPEIEQVHDMWARNDTLFISAGYQGLYIMTYNATINKFSLLSHLSIYPFAGYNHSTTWSADGELLVMADEVPQSLPLKLVDVSNIFEPNVVTYFNTSDSATPHNPYFLGSSRVFIVSWYEDGLRVFNGEDMSNPIEIGYFDTHFQTTSLTNTGNYRGNWGAFVDFNDGIVLANDMQNGLFVLDISPALVGIKKSESGSFNIWPLPASNVLHISLNHPEDIKEAIICDATGRILNIPFKIINNTIDISSLKPGMYCLQLFVGNHTLNKKFIVQ